ncbi:MAG: msbA, partial [Phycisphaerales bacterium]|nr:msbA [Phycisphaerales bacterium]
APGARRTVYPARPTGILPGPPRTDPRPVAARPPPMTTNGQPHPAPAGPAAEPPAAPDPAGLPARQNDQARSEPKRGTRDFWRAMAFVWPYRRTIAVSVVCAFFVGLAISGSLTAITPVLRVLLSKQTVQQWVDGVIAERRLGVRLLEGTPEAQVAQVKPDGAAAKAGLENGDSVLLPADAEVADRPAISQTPGHTPRAAATAAVLADPAATVAVVRRERHGQIVPVTLPLDPVPPHLVALRRAASVVSPDPVWALAQIFVALGLLSTTGNVLKFFQEYLSDKVAVSAVHDVRRKLYDHILHVPMSHFGRHGTSDVTSRLVQDSAALEVGFKTVLGQSVQQPIISAMAFGVALYTSWKLTLVIIVFVPIMGAVIQKFGKKMRRTARAAMQKNSAMLGQIAGTLNGVRVVKSAGAERWERRRYRGIMRQLMGEQFRMSKLEAAGSPIMETVTLVVVGTIVLIATYMVTKSQTLSIAEFFLVMACLGTIGDSMRRLNKVNGVLQRASASAERIFEVINLPVERRRELRRPDGRGGRDEEARDAAIAATGTVNGTGVSSRTGHTTTDDGPLATDQGPRAKDQGLRQSVKLKPLADAVRFEHVTFAYPGSPTPALVDVSLTVRKGTCVAVVGRNGSGKTTLLALLPRFYDVDGGRVTVDGVDVRDATLRSLRGQISLVTQDSVIFPGTIAENVAYGHPLAGRLRDPAAANVPTVKALRAAVEDAARRAFAHDFILEKPAGYDTVLDGLGSQLSGGQKQRLCIARAILRRAPILILDEATSQVDAESEHLIQQAVDGLLREGHAAGAAGQPNGDWQANGGGLGSHTGPPTVFVIAHRFATIRSADVIVVMERGRVVGQGGHEELLRTCDVYRQLYERQLIAAPGAA